MFYGISLRVPVVSDPKWSDWLSPDMNKAETAECEAETSVASSSVNELWSEVLSSYDLWRRRQTWRVQAPASSSIICHILCTNIRCHKPRCVSQLTDAPLTLSLASLQLHLHFIALHTFFTTRRTYTHCAVCAVAVARGPSGCSSVRLSYAGLFWNHWTDRGCFRHGGNPHSGTYKNKGTFIWNIVRNS